MHKMVGNASRVKCGSCCLKETKEYTYNNIGQLTGTKSVQRSGEVVEDSYKYDAFGRLTSKTSNDGSVQDYTYDSNSNVTKYTLTKDWKTQNSVEYAYNSLNQLTKLENNGIITSYEYDANGNMTRRTQDNGVVTEYEYNLANIMDYYKSKGISASFIYTVDGMMKSAMGGVSWSNNFDYDKAGRLVYEERCDFDSPNESNTYISYEYNSFGNRTKKTETQRERTSVINKITTDYQYDLNNRLINSSYSDTIGNSGATRYYYDKNGNQTAVQRSVYGNADGGLPLPTRLHLAHSLHIPSACRADVEGNPVWSLLVQCPWSPG